MGAAARPGAHAVREALRVQLGGPRAAEGARGCGDLQTYLRETRGTKGITDDSEF